MRKVPPHCCWLGLTATANIIKFQYKNTGVFFSSLSLCSWTRVWELAAPGNLLCKLLADRPIQDFVRSFLHIGTLAEIFTLKFTCLAHIFNRTKILVIRSTHFPGMTITETLLNIEGTCNRNEAKVIFHGKHSIYSPTKEKLYGSKGNWWICKNEKRH